MLKRLLGLQLHTPVLNTVRYTRSMNPSVKIAEERFEITVDVRQFTIDEIYVKAHPEFVIIEAKQKRNTPEGLLIRQYIKKFKLPKGCIIEEMESKLSADGILTVSAPRSYCEEVCNTIMVPIHSDPNKTTVKPDTSRELPEPCASYKKVKALDRS